MQRCRSLLLAACLIVLHNGLLVGAAESRPNVLFILVDDLRPDLACYGDEHVKSPHIDRFAATALRFDRAYCQQSVCNPSRTSLLTGRRPDTIRVTGNHVHFRSNHPDVLTLPQYFKQQGYHTSAIGKIYHGVFPKGASRTTWDTMGDPQSWSVPAVRFGPRYYYTEKGVAVAKSVYQQVYQPVSPQPDDWTRKLLFGLATEAPDVPDNRLYDGQVADATVRRLEELKQRQDPFFLAVGFIKPHSPYVAPKKYFDLYDDVPLASQTSLPAGAPSFAGHGSSELRRYTDQPAKGPIPDENQRRVRLAYRACTSYIDAQVGRVLMKLEQLELDKNTIVVLCGDHGYHLGEKGLWGKTTNYELDTRVPLIMRVPNMKTAGQSTSALVELVDLYPTLADLAGLPINKGLEGNSLRSILDDPMQSIKSFAVSQYPRPGGLMGYSLRTATHRLILWLDRNSQEVRATELYDYADGLVEKENIASQSPALVNQLAARLASLRNQTDRQGDPPIEAERLGLESFENIKAGPFDKLETAVGSWTPIAGTTIVDDQHAKTGSQCLQLTGGEKTSLVLELNDDLPTAGSLSFWAERWTARAPFSFRIDRRSDGKWQEIYRGDKAVRVGRAFLSKVKVPLPTGTRQLRLTVTSPPNTGILIDDIRIAPDRPQTIESVEVVPSVLPALVGAENSPLLKLKIKTEGSLQPISVIGLQGSLHATTDPADLQSVSIRFAGSEFKQSIETPRPGQGKPAEANFKFSIEPGSWPLAEGENGLWIGGQLSQQADIDGRVGVHCQQIMFSNGQTIQFDAADEPVHATQRIGVALRKGGDDGVHTYRIPGLVTTKAGTLIAVYDIRHRSGGDLPGDIDVGMSRSTDGGRTWEPMKTIMDMGNDPNWHYDGIGDPAVLVDQTTNTIWVAATWSHGNRSWRGSGPGLKPQETGQLMLVRSDDDGVSWSKPINITEQVKRPEWSFILQGPGKGITMQDGTIAFAAQYQDPPNPDKSAHRLPHSTIIYSRDHGQTWQAGTGAFDDTTESQVVEIEPGVLMLNCRYNRAPTRVVMTTRDMGRTWQAHPTSQRSLIEPRACMASLIDVDREVGQDLGNWLLFSNPDSKAGRHHITIKASPDRGATWPKEHRLLLDEGTGGGYSCMAMIDPQTVGILYEGSQAHLTFQRIALSELLGQADTPTDPAPKKSRQSLQLPSVFGSRMVLQAGVEVPVWGHAPEGSQVTATLGQETKTATADAHGQWQVRFAPRRASAAPVTLSIESAGERIELQDVLVGEVWVCAGQSNMAWPLNRSTHGQRELAGLDHPQIRLLHLAGDAGGQGVTYREQQLATLTPATYCRGQWKVASQNSAQDFSAVAWHFGRHLHENLQVPIGLICTAVGGTPTEAWIPCSALQADPQLKGLVAGNWLDNEQLGEFCRTRGEQNLLAAMQSGETIPGDELGPNHPFKPGFMWGASVEPLIPFGIRGVIWYQGESNAETVARVGQHNQLFPLLVNQWRDQWGQGPFPWLYVQLPAINRPQWPLFRESQRRALGQLENVGMAITIDTGHESNVHPPLKKPVGERLAKWAIGTTYRPQDRAACGGPLFDSAERHGEAIVVSFKQAGSGLKSSDNQQLRHFEVCGRDGQFHEATAKILNKNTLSVTSPRVAEPRHVRYAWRPLPAPPVNLFNDAGLPASPFSTESSDRIFTETIAEPITLRDSKHPRRKLPAMGQNCENDPRSHVANPLTQPRAK